MVIVFERYNCKQMNTVSPLLIGAQSQAEKDASLIECFHDSGFLKSVIENDYSILAGRKGAGKTAVARFLEQKYNEYDLLFCKRISITSFSDEKSTTTTQGIRERILIFILLTVAQELRERGYLLNDSGYWKDVFNSLGLGKTSTYESFKTKSRKSRIASDIKILGASIEEQNDETNLELNSETLFASLADSLEEISPLTSYLFL